MFPGPVGTGEGQWELRLNPEGGTALHGREGHGALLARRWEGLEAGEAAVSQGGVRSGNAGGPMPLAAAPAPRECRQAKAACIATPAVEVGAHGPLPIATSLCSLWTLLSSSWPEGPEEE